MIRINYPIHYVLWRHDRINRLSKTRANVMLVLFIELRLFMEKCVINCAFG